MEPMKDNPLKALAEQVGRPSTMLDNAGNAVKADFGRQVGFVGEVIQFLYNFAVLVLSAFAIPVEAFLRYQFGQRYFTLGKAAVGYLLILVYWNLFALSSIFSGPTPGMKFLTNLVCNAYLIACLFHVLTIQYRHWKGIRCHSRYAGNSWPIWTRLPFYEAIGGQQTVQRYLEPLLLFILGILTSYIHGGLATFLYMGGISLFIKGYVQAAGEKQRILDIIDQQIEAEQITRAVTNWQDPSGLQTEGVVIPAGYAKYSESRQQAPRTTTDNLRAASQATIPLLRKLFKAVDELLESKEEREKTKEKQREQG